MKVEGVAAVADFLGDNIIYRSLTPADPRLPGYEAFVRSRGDASPVLPRKSDPAYAQVVLFILEQAQALRGAERGLRELIYIGDSVQLDMEAFRNLQRESGWPTWAFIGRDTASEPPALRVEDHVSYGNRWALLPDFLRRIGREGARLGGSSAVVVDLDKTVLGPRGRNDGSIDAARTAAALRCAEKTVPDAAVRERFVPVYEELNQPRYHFFTGDNQDYLVYIALATAAGLYDFEALKRDLADGRLSTFADFLDVVDRRVAKGEAPGLQGVHREVMDNYRKGDPTPFKSFRREEYLATVERMCADTRGRATEVLLGETITLNYEVAQALAYLGRRGLLLFALSDKPDEAVFPTAELAARGYRPLHRVSTSLVGEPLQFGPE